MNKKIVYIDMDGVIVDFGKIQLPIGLTNIHI